MKNVLILFLVFFFVGCQDPRCPKKYVREKNRCIKYEYVNYDYEYQCDEGYILYGQACSNKNLAIQDTILAKKVRVCPDGYEPVEGIFIKRCKKAINEISVK